jgi:transcriptional regulator with XRE-family HTH domain
MLNQPDVIDVDVGARIRIRRKSMGVTQMKLAEALGLTFQQIQKYEKGSNRVSASMLVKIARELDTTVGALVGEHDHVGLPTPMLSLLATPGAAKLLAAYARLPVGSGDHLVAFIETLCHGAGHAEPTAQAASPVSAH